MSWKFWEKEKVCSHEYEMSYNAQDDHNDSYIEFYFLGTCIHCGKESNPTFKISPKISGTSTERFTKYMPVVLQRLYGSCKVVNKL